MMIFAGAENSVFLMAGHDKTPGLPLQDRKAGGSLYISRLYTSNSQDFCPKMLQAWTARYTARFMRPYTSFRLQNLSA